MKEGRWGSWLRRVVAACAARQEEDERPYLKPVALRVTRLEERRVLNGAVPVVAVTNDDGHVVLDAGTGDGDADTYVISREEGYDRELLRIRVDGALVYEGNADEIRSITIIGSADEETFIVDYSRGAPMPAQGIVLRGQAGAAGDHIGLVHGDAQNVTYVLVGANEGRIEILAADGARGQVEFVGSFSSINDELRAETREFAVVGASATVVVEGAATAGSSCLTVSDGEPGGSGRLGVTIAHPSERLLISAAGVLELRGLGEGFGADLETHSDQLLVTGPVGLAQGGLQAQARQVAIDGGIWALNGPIELVAAEDMRVACGATVAGASRVSLEAPMLIVDGRIAVSAGGHVRLDAGTTGTLLVSGSVEAGAEAGTGGTIDLSGQRVGVLHGAVLDASGADGGGTIRIGGDFQGANEQFPNAQRTFIDSGVEIRADALASGHGGRVIIWSDEATGFYGNIFARGGPLAGDGGLAEVSSAGLLVYRGQTDLTAAAGQTGTLLLDPLKVIIKNQSTAANDAQLDADVPNPGDAAGVILFADDPGSTYTISETALESATSHVIIQARESIVVENLTTDGVILLPANINLTLQTRNSTVAGDPATGGITFNNTANTIQAQGTGTITIQAGVDATATGAVVSRQGEADASVGRLITAGGEIVVEASRHVTANRAIESNGGKITLAADANADGTGVVTLTSNAQVSSAGGDIVVVGADLVMLGSAKINSGAGTTFLFTTAGRTMALGAAVADWTLANSELSGITAATLVVGNDMNGNITVDGVGSGPSNNVGVVTLVAAGGGRRVVFSGAASIFNALVVQADNGMQVDANVTSDTGDIIFDGDLDQAADGDDRILFASGARVRSAGSLTLRSATGQLEGAGSVILEANTGITLEHGLTTAGELTVNADRDANGVGVLSVKPGAAINANGQPITVTSGDIILDGSLTSAGGTVRLLTTAGRTMALGMASADWTLDGGEISRTTAGVLQIGGTTNGNILVDGVSPAESANIARVELAALAGGQQIRFAGHASTFQELSVRADNGIAIEVDLSTAAGELLLVGDADGAADGNDRLEMSPGVTLTAGTHMTLRSHTGKIHGLGELTLDANNGITLLSDMFVNGNLVIDADNNLDGAGTLELISVGINSFNHDILVQSADINLAESLQVNAGTGKVTLVTGPGRTMAVGTAAGDWTLENKELVKITASELVIGNGNNGNITVAGVTAGASNNVGVVRLVASGAGRTITFDGAASTFNALVARADNGIAVNANLTTDTGGLELDGDLDGAADGADSITFAAGVVVQSQQALLLRAATGDMAGAGALTLRGNNGVTLEDSLATAGPLTVNADFDGNGTGTFAVFGGATVNSSGNSLAVTSAEIDLAGGLDSGAGTTTLQTTAGRTLGVGTAAGDWTLDNGELSRIVAATLVIGGNSGSGNISVDGVDAGSSDGVGLLHLLASANGTSITFGASASTFNALLAQADNGIAVNGNITTDTGDMSLDGDRDSAADGADSIALAAGVVLQSAGSLSLKATTGDMTGAGALDLLANNGVTISDSLTTAGPLTIDADVDGNGAGLLTITAGTTVHTSGNALSATSSDIVLLGNLNSGAGTTTLATTAGRAMGVGTAVGDWTLDNAELTRITAAELVIGNGNNGNITVAGVTAGASNNVGVVRLVASGAGRSITFSGAASTFNALVARADNGIAVNANLTTDTGGLELDGDLDGAADGADSITFAAGVVVQSQQALLLRAATGDMAGAGSLTLRANNGVTLEDSLATAGGLTVDADTNDDGLGTLFVAAGAAVNTSNHALNITAADIELLGTLESGTAAMTLEPSAGGLTAGVGDASADFSISAAELARIVNTTGQITIGSLSHTGGMSIAVDEPISTGDRQFQFVTGGELRVAGPLGSTTGNLTLLAGTDLRLLSSGTFGSTSGNILLQADALPGNTGGKVILEDGSLVDAGSGRIEIVADGDVIVGRLVTSNEVWITSTSGGIVDGGDSGGRDIVATATALVAAAGIGSANPLDITVATLAASNDGPGNIRINHANGAVFFIGVVNGVSGVSNTDPALGGGSIFIITDAPFEIDAPVTCATLGEIHLETVSTMSVDAPVTTTPGAGGTLTILGAVTVNAPIAVGTGNVTLIAAELECQPLIIDADIIQATSIILSSTCDIIVAATLKTTSPDADIILTADSDLDGDGGVWVKPEGAIISGRDVILQGSEVHASDDAFESIRISADPGGDQVVAAGKIIFRSGPAAPAGAGIIVEDDVRGGSVQFVALDEITLDGDSTIEATTGSLRMEAGGDITIGTLKSATLVALTTTSGGIVDGRAAPGPDIIAPQAAFRAAAGAGHGDPLETSVSTVAASNSASGDISLSNNVGGLLSIGTVDGLSGVTNTGGGAIVIINASPLSVDADVTNHGGNIELTSVGDGSPGNDLTTNARVASLGGNGNIHLNAGTDLIINDTGHSPDLEVQNGGQIIGVAQRHVILGPNVTVDTATGRIFALTPSMVNVEAPQVDITGLSVIKADVGDPGARGYVMVIDWGDGTVDTYYVRDPGHFEATHVYAANPDTANPSAPIPIVITANDDPSSTFVGLQMPPPVSVQINDTDVVTTGVAFTRVATFAEVPGDGKQFIRIDTTLRVPQLAFPANTTVAYVSEAVAARGDSSQSAAELNSAEEEVAAEARQVILEVLDPDGQIVNRVALPEDVLDDLAGLFARLPDGHYKIYVKEVGETRERLLLDLNLRGGKPASDAEGSEDKPPTGDASARLGPAGPNDKADVALTQPATRAAPPGISKVSQRVPPAAISAENDLLAAAPDMGAPERAGLGAAGVGLGIAAPWSVGLSRWLASPARPAFSKSARMARRLKHKLLALRDQPARRLAEEASSCHRATR